MRHWLKYGAETESFMSMLDPSGARRQESLREHPAIEGIRNIDRLVKGVIKPHGVSYKDQNKSGQTLVDISLYGGYPDIYGVPVASGKFNKGNGVEWTPDPGDVVLVQFINGNFSNPVVVGMMPLADNEVLASKADAPPGQRRYHMRCNGTDVQIDKGGTRRVHVAKDDVLEITGDGRVVVGGNLTIEVSGNANIKAGQVNVNTPLCTMSGNLLVAGEIMFGSVFMVSDGAGGHEELQTSGGETVTSVTGTLRDIYNSHTHISPHGQTTTPNNTI